MGNSQFGPGRESPQQRRWTCQRSVSRRPPTPRDEYRNRSRSTLGAAPSELNSDEDDDADRDQQEIAELWDLDLAPRAWNRFVDCGGSPCVGLGAVLILDYYREPCYGVCRRRSNSPDVLERDLELIHLVRSVKVTAPRIPGIARRWTSAVFPGCCVPFLLCECPGTVDSKQTIVGVWQHAPVIVLVEEQFSAVGGSLVRLVRGSLDADIEIAQPRSESR